MQESRRLVLPEHAASRQRLANTRKNSDTCGKTSARDALMRRLVDCRTALWRRLAPATLAPSATTSSKVSRSSCAHRRQATLPRASCGEDSACARVLD